METPMLVFGRARNEEPFHRPEPGCVVAGREDCKVEEAEVVPARSSPRTGTKAVSKKTADAADFENSAFMGVFD